MAFFYSNPGRMWISVLAVFLVGGDECVDGAVGLEIGIGGGADVFEGDCLVFGFFFFPPFVAEAVEFVQRSYQCHASKVLTGDFFLPQYFGFGAFELGFGKAVLAKGLNFLGEFLIDAVGVFRGSAGVEDEVAGNEAGNVMRSNIVGEAELIADAKEKTGAEVAAGFLQEVKGVAFFVGKGCALGGNDDDGLFFVHGSADLKFANGVRFGLRENGVALFWPLTGA